MTFYVYVIKCNEGRYYVGQTQNIDERIKNHNKGLFGWTKNFYDWKLVYSEKYKTRKEAIVREKYLKSLKGGNAFKKIIDAG